MLRTEADIIGAVSDKEKDSQVIGLRARFEDDYDKWRLTTYQLGKKDEYDNYTSNEPRTLVDKIVDTLSTAPRQIRIDLKKAPEAERDNISQAERYCYGALNLADYRLQSFLQPVTQEQLSFFATLRGWTVKRVFIHKNKEGETIVDIAIWDPLQCTWDIGANGLLWVCHTRTITPAQAKAEYGIDEKTNVKIYDFWDEEINAVIAGSKFVKPPKSHELDHLPAFINTVGSVPFIQSTKYTDTLKDSGESIFGANRHIFDFKNKLMTLYTTITAQAAHNPLALYSKGGKKTFEKSPYYKGAVLQFDIDKGEKAEALYKPEMPRDVDKLLGYVTRELGAGGLAPILQGILEFQESGYGINLLRHAASSLLFPRQATVEEDLSWICRELLVQYRKGGFKKLRLHGRDAQDEYFDMELSPQDIKGDWFPEVKLLPVLPEDEAAKYAMAQTAVQNELLSPQTAMDKLLGVQDTNAEYKRILLHKARRLPPVMLMQMAQAFIEDGRPDLANIFLAELYRMGEGGQQTAPKSEAVEPQFATGMPEEVLPPEEMGRVQKPPAEREKFRGSEIRELGL